MIGTSILVMLSFCLGVAFGMFMFIWIIYRRFYK